MPSKTAEAPPNFLFDKNKSRSQSIARAPAVGVFFFVKGVALKSCPEFPELRGLSGSERLAHGIEHIRKCSYCRRAVSGYHNGSLDKEIERHAKRITGTARLRESERSMTHAMYRHFLAHAHDEQKRAMLLLFKHPAGLRRKRDERAGMGQERFQGMFRG